MARYDKDETYIYGPFQIDLIRNVPKVKGKRMSSIFIKRNDSVVSEFAIPSFNGCNVARSVGEALLSAHTAGVVAATRDAA